MRGGGKRTLLCLQPSTQNLVGICRGSGAYFTKYSRAEYAGPVQLAVRRAHFQSSELRLEILVEGKLDRDVGKTEQGRSKAGVECPPPLVDIHLAERIECILIVPRWAVLFRGTGADLRHQPCLDDPNRIRRKRRTCASRYRGRYAGEPCVVWIVSTKDQAKELAGQTYARIEKVL